ncbi:PREDICTED: tumor necrosis factor receptor superfamily member 1B [Elephantulus edwardii]|uniref:tumor necrosis factor receptor superfamily member 1B n=1 Tax=Elephantulus edwardii TaxID=28737 RepID=UPI0003F0E56E|nr:PREDICTED: tumor necrosis factor receptor superfamily member 1B [Elephantulus edwardii]
MPSVSGDFAVPYALEPGTECRPKEYYDQRAQMCCSKCPPGKHVKNFCTTTSDTVCDTCEDSTYTQLWNWVSECLSCNSRCSSDQVEVQACTREQNRICNCKPGWYCTLKRQEGCRLCAPLRKCRPGFGVAKPGTETSDVVCAPCAPGTFSNTTSSTDACRPHRICSSVAVPGNASMDTVCGPPGPTLILGSIPTLQPEAPRPQPMTPTPGPDVTRSTSPLLSLGQSPPVEGLSAASMALPIGLIVGMTAVGLLLIMLVNCIILTQRKKKPSCLPGEAKVPHLLPDKARGAPGPEQQHLLTTATSSSSSSLESSASAADRRGPPRNQPQAPGMEKASGVGEAWASCTTSEPSPGGGTQVNVTCIVNVCSSSDHGPKCPSQASSMTGDTEPSPSDSPKDEKVHFSEEECAFQSQPGTLETLPQNSEKPLPLGVLGVGMKPC